METSGMTDTEARLKEIKETRLRCYDTCSSELELCDGYDCDCAAGKANSNISFLIEQLRAAQQTIEMEDMACSESHKVDRERIKELKAENAELRRDKERLDRAERSTLDNPVELFSFTDGSYAVEYGQDRTVTSVYATLREALDAAQVGDD